jgi:hypothetical protein
MTISSVLRRAGPFNGNGSTTVFAREFMVLDADHLKVYQTIAGVTTEVTSGISKDGIGTDAGNVTFSTAPAIGTQITILREIPLVQETDYSNQGSVEPERVEDDFDLQEMKMQELSETLGRALRLPITSSLTNLVIPDPVSGKTIVGKADGTGWEDGPTAAQIAAANAEALAAAASATAASGFSTAAGLSADEAAAYAAGLIGGTGVTSDFTVTAANGGTVFTISALSATIHSSLVNLSFAYAGAADVTIANLAVSSTYVYLDSSGVLQQQGTTPTREDWSRKVFLVRIAVDTAAGTVIGFEYLSNTIGHYSNTIRDFYNTLLAQGIPFKLGQAITGNAGNLKWGVGAGKAFELGGSGDIHNPNFVDFDAVANAEYTLMERTLAGTGGQTDLVKFWDNAGSITALGSGTFVAHRLYRFSSGNFVIQYGQGNYANLALAKVGVLQEEYVLNPLLVNATFFGWWFIGQTASNSLGVDGLTKFTEYTIGAQGGNANALFAPLASPTFTGVPAAPSPAASTDTTQVATTAYVRAAIADVLNATGSAPLYGCRAWVKFNAAGTISASGNVSSVTKNGTGDYTVNFTTAMQDANFVAIGQSGDDSNFMVVTAATSSSVRFDNLSRGSTINDVTFGYVAIFR